MPRSRRASERYSSWTVARLLMVDRDSIAPHASSARSLVPPLHLPGNRKARLPRSGVGIPRLHADGKQDAPLRRHVVARKPLEPPLSAAVPELFGRVQLAGLPRPGSGGARGELDVLDARSGGKRRADVAAGGTAPGSSVPCAARGRVGPGKGHDDDGIARGRDLGRRGRPLVLGTLDWKEEEDGQ